MPLILDYEPAAALYRRCGDARLTMARIGYSDQHHLLGIVEGAARFARDFDFRFMTPEEAAEDYAAGLEALGPAAFASL